MQLRFFQQFQVCLGLFHKLFLKPLLVWKWMSSWKKKRFLNQNWGCEWSQVKQMGKKQIQLFQSFEEVFKFILGNDFWNLFWMMSKTLFQDWKPFRPKKRSLVSGSRPFKMFLSPTRLHNSNVYEDTYLLFQKNTHTNKKISTSKFIRTNLRFFPFKQLKIGLFVFQ